MTFKQILQLSESVSLKDLGTEGSKNRKWIEWIENGKPLKWDSMKVFQKHLEASAVQAMNEVKGTECKIRDRQGLIK